MPNYTTYYTADNWEKLKDEDNKSKLINDLLANHYDVGASVSVSDPNARKVPSEENQPTFNESQKEEIKTAMVNSFKGLCPAGHILGRNDKCMQKGCKYA